MTGLAATATLLVTAGCSAAVTPDNAGSTEGLTTVTLAFDYLPAPSHSGIAYAIQEGLFEDEGLDVQILPWGSTSPETLVASGQADFGLSNSNITFIQAAAAGVPLVSLFVSSRSPAEVAVLADSGIERPSDLAGTIYGGFGVPAESAFLNTMIKNDGGTGTTDEVVLSVGAYEALKSGQVDSVLAYLDQIYENEQDGIAMTIFHPEDYGVPPSTAWTAITDKTYAEEHPEIMKGFVSALQQGYQAAIDDPDAAADALIAQFPDEVNPDMARWVGQEQAKELLPNEFGPVGTASLEEWQAVADWMAEWGLLTDGDGEPIAEFDISPFVSNDYITG